MTDAAAKPPEPLLSLRVHPSIAAGFLLTLAIGTWTFIGTVRENDLSHAAAIAELRKDLTRLEGQVKELRDELRGYRSGRGNNGGP